MKLILLCTLIPFVFGACQSSSNETTGQAESSNQQIEEQNKDEPLPSIEKCFQLDETVEGATTRTYISVEIAGEEVFGEEVVTMEGPEYNATAVGSFEGKIVNGVVTVLYEYTIEGSLQKEQQEFKILNDTLFMSFGPLKEIDDTLVLEKTGLFNKKIPQIRCL